AMISAVAHFAEDSGRDFAGEICVSCTVHEECFEGVSSREITRLAKPDFVIIGEATSTTVKIGQRGRAEVVVETEGVSCHSSNPDKGVNAVYHMMAVIEEIRRIIPNEHPILGKGILELTDIISSPYPGASVVPALCRATFDRRTLTGENEAVILGQVEEAIARAREKIPGLKARTYLAE
ncbi:Flavodoxin domain-containing protein, partial [Dysosmobacter welbionis]